MVYTGYLNFGGREIINADRTAMYVRTLLPNLELADCAACTGLFEALGYPPYASPLVDNPSWFDADNTDTWDFYGLFPITFEGFEDSTVSASVTEFATDGGTSAMARHGTRSVRVTGLLIGQDEAAVSAGMVWLRSVLQARKCATNPVSCGGDHLSYFVACPPLCTDSPALDSAASVAECATGAILSPLSQCALPYERHLYNTVCVDGPRIINVFAPKCGAMSMVEFTFVAGVPTPFGTAQQISSTLADPGQLEPYFDYSCEDWGGLGGGLEVHRVNGATNPGPTLPDEGWTTLDNAFWVNSTTQAAESIRTNWAWDPRATSLDANRVLSARSTRGFGLTATTRTNLVRNPAMTLTSLGWNFTANGSIGWNGAVGISPGAVVWTCTTAFTGGAGGTQFCGSATGYSAADVDPSTQYAISLYVHPSRAMNLFIQANWRDSAGTEVTTSQPGPTVACPANVWTRLVVVAVSPANAVAGGPRVRAASGQVMQVGDVVAIDNGMVEEGSAESAYFDGDTPDTSTSTYTWTGAPQASPSTATAFTPAAGTYQVVSGSFDGPFGGLTSFVRKTWTVPPANLDTSGRTGTDFGSLTSGQALEVAPGDTWTFSIWARASRRARLALDVRVGDATGDLIPQGWADQYGNPGGENNQPGVTAASVTSSNTWVHLQLRLRVPDAITRVCLIVDRTASAMDAAVGWQAGDTFDATALLAENVNGMGDWFDGSSPNVNNRTHAWFGTPNASPSTETSLIQATNPGTNQPLSGLSILSRRTITGGWAPQVIGAAGFVGAYGTTAATAPMLVPQVSNTVSVWMFASVAGFGQVEVQPIGDDGLGVGPSFTGSSGVVAASTWVRPSVTFFPPKGAGRLRITARMLVPSGFAGANAMAWFAQCLVEGVPGVLPYFDGDSTSPDPTIGFDWVGLRGHAWSQMFQAVVLLPIVDPDCPQIPPPPRPPVVESVGCVEDPAGGDLRRLIVSIPADFVPRWSDVVPILRFTTNEAPVRQLRVRFYDNPGGVPQYALVQCAFIGEFIVSYIPPFSTLTIDGTSREVLITAPTGLSRSASHLLYGSAGGPVIWPSLACGGQYDLAVDLYPDPADPVVQFELCVAGRE